MIIHTLPVTEEERQSWVPKLPEKLTKASTDYVSYIATGSTPRDFPSTACYSAIRYSYNQFEILCRPLQRPKAISLEDALLFFSIMAEHLIIPEDLELWEEEKGIYCRIPKGVATNPLIYSALTCYRWLDSCPPLIWQFLRIMEQPEKRHPLQILPFLIQKHVSNCNHSFITTKSWQADLMEFATATNPLLGLAARIFFDPLDPRRKKDREEPSTVVNTTISKLSREISPTTCLKNPTKWGPQGRKVPAYKLEQPEDNLHPDLYHLYTIPTITKEQIQDILSSLFTKELQCKEPST